MSASFLKTSISLQVIQAFSDGLYASPAIFSARKFFQRSNRKKQTFFYHFSHNTKTSPYNQVNIHMTVWFTNILIRIINPKRSSMQHPHILFLRNINSSHRCSNPEFSSFQLTAVIQNEFYGYFALNINATANAIDK